MCVAVARDSYISNAAQMFIHILNLRLRSRGTAPIRPEEAKKEG